MPRVNIMLDDDTMSRLSRHAKHLGLPSAAAARSLIQEALARRERMERRRKLAEDYTAGREDASRLLRVMEPGQWDLLDED